MAEPRRHVDAMPAISGRAHLDRRSALLRRYRRFASGGATRALEQAGAMFDRVSVPGSLEIPPAIAIALAPPSGREAYEGVVALGCVIRGDTIHFEIVSTESAPR